VGDRDFVSVLFVRFAACTMEDFERVTAVSLTYLDFVCNCGGNTFDDAVSQCIATELLC
jgi:hypothetical protein